VPRPARYVERNSSITTASEYHEERDTMSKIVFRTIKFVTRWLVAFS
jgi:hypothetical protein